MARYDSRTTTFSPEGRLYQVEYAMAAIQNAGACVGIKTANGIIIAAEKKDASKLLANSKISDKLYRVDSHIVCAVAGLTSDANVLLNYLRRSAQNYRTTYQEPEPMEQLLRRVCDLKQGYTQFGGQRPFGVSFLYAGYDNDNGYQLYHSDPAGNYSSWLALAIGKHEGEANQMLKEEFSDDKLGLSAFDTMGIDEGKKLVVKVLRKALEQPNDLHKKIEVVVIERIPNPKGHGDSVDSTSVSVQELAKIVTALETEEKELAK